MKNVYLARSVREIIMGQTTEYLIKWEQPEGYNPSSVLQQLPSPISRDIKEIYNYSVEPEGFYVFDRNIDSSVVGYAIKLFIDEALRYSESVEVIKKYTS